MSQFARGNEEIFESLASEEKSVPMAAQEDVKTADLPFGCTIDSSSINPSVSFECFAGKTYFTSSADRRYYSLADCTERRVESAEQKYSRLKCEVNQLIDDLNVAACNDSSTVDMNWSSLARETSELLLLLERLPSSAKDPQLSNRKPSNTKAVSNITPPSTSCNEMLPAIDMRVEAIESQLGVPSGSSAPLLSTLEKLERQLQLIAPESGHSDSMRNKLNSLKSELDDLFKDKKGGGSKLLDAAKRLQYLHDKVLSIDSLVSDLPRLLLRLKTLQSLHVEAAGVKNRLAAVESSAAGIEKHLNTNASILAELTKGFEENMTTLNSNLQQTEMRIAALEK